MPRTVKKPKPAPVSLPEPQPAGVNGPADEVLTLAEAAAYLRLAEKDVIAAATAEGLPGRIISGEWRFLKSALQQWLSVSQPTEEMRRAALLAFAGAWKDDPDLEDMVEEIYRKRGRPITEDGSYRLFHGLNPEDFKMILLDTDMFTLLAANHPKVKVRVAAAREVAITVVTRVEALEGRFAFLMRAADGETLLRAQRWLQQTEADLARLPLVLFNTAAAAEFNRLLGMKGMKKIGRGDTLIASIALANHATLVTRNTKDFRKVPGLQIENWAD